MPNFPIVDTHVHLWDPDVLTYPWLNSVPALNRAFLPDDYRKHCGPVQVEQMVFLECDLDPDQFLEEARWVSALSQNEEPRLTGIVAHAPLQKGDAVRANLEALSQIPGVKGVRRLIQSESVDFCVQPHFVKGVQALADFGLSCDLCIYHPQLANLIKLVKQCPHVNFVLDHIGKPGIKNGLFDPWRTELQQLAQFPNVWCKLSGVVTEADHTGWKPEDLKPYIDHVMAVFGFDRVMYGGDWPVSTLATDYPTWVRVLDDALSGCSERELKQVYCETAIAFYRL
jgi:L-fuconolactonase